MPLVEIHAADDPRLGPYRHLNAANLARGSGRFIAEGGLLVDRLLASGLGVESVLLDESHWERYRERIAPEIPVFLTPRGLVTEIVGFKFHRGVLACGRRPGRRTLSQLLGDRATGRLTAVVGVHIQDPENLGSILRSAAAFGAEFAVLTGGCADPFSRRVLRTSMGAVLNLPIVEAEEEAAIPPQLRAAGAELIATVLADDALPLDRVVPSPRTALVFGSEGTGLDERWIGWCDRRVTIPMQRGTDSLNVSVAAGVFLHHFTRDSLIEARAAKAY